MIATIVCALLCLAAGGAMYFNYLSLTDAETEFCTVGPVWIRYAAVGAVVLIVWLLSFTLLKNAKELPKNRNVPMSVLLVLQAVAFLFAGVLLILSLTMQARVSSSVRPSSAPSQFILLIAVLFLIDGVWCIFCAVGSLSAAPLAHGSSAGGIAVFATMFLICIYRFITSPTSVQRIRPTMDVVCAVAAMLQCGSLLRFLYLPRTADSLRRNWRWGLICFLFCFCMIGSKWLYLAGSQSAAVEDVLDIPILFWGLLGLCVSAGALNPPAGEAAETQVKKVFKAGQNMSV